MRIGRSFGFVSLLALWSVAASQTASTLPVGRTLPDGHPTTAASNRFEAASDLTERIVGALSAGQAGAVARGPKAVPRKNLIDEYIFGRMEREGIPHAPLASDEEFIRRLYLDLTGRIPDATAVEKFLADSDPDKRDQLIDDLVPSEASAAKWTHLFVDMTRPLSGTIGTEGVNLYYSYIHDAYRTNLPFDRLVRDLITANAYSNSFNGPATYLATKFVLAPINSMIMHEDSADEMTIALFRDFMGVNLQCVSCHDGARHLEKVNLYLTGKKRQEFWSQAAFFGGTRLERGIRPRRDAQGKWVWVGGGDDYTIQDDAPGYSLEAPSQIRLPRRGKGIAEPAFILTGEKPQPGRPLREELARMMTSHPQFARATVNRFWAELMGMGLVEPVYDFDLLRLDPEDHIPAGFDVQPAFPELLEALAADFATRPRGPIEVIHQGGHTEQVNYTTTYDLQALIKMICKSSAYQLSATFPGEWKASYAKYFARRFVRRLSAEQVYDSMVEATGRFTEIPVRGLVQRARYMTETRTPENISGRNPREPKELAQFLNELQFFLESFGASNRRTTEPTAATAMTQAVLLLNSPVVKDKIQVSKDSYLGKLLATGDWSNDRLVEKLFLQFLSRRPTAEERTQAAELLAKKGQHEGGEELQWALLNKLEFIFNQ